MPLGVGGPYRFGYAAGALFSRSVAAFRVAPAPVGVSGGRGALRAGFGPVSGVFARSAVGGRSGRGDTLGSALGVVGRTTGGRAEEPGWVFRV